LTGTRSVATLHEMEKVLHLKKYGKHLWTRELAKEIREELNKLLSGTSIGDTIIISANGVEVFDYSFANELFGKSLFALGIDFPGRFLVVEGLTPYTRENLVKALESLNLAMIERKKQKLEIIGKIHPAYQETFKVISVSKDAISANSLTDKLNINLTATNERLAKLTAMGLVRRKKATSTAGREQFLYTVLR
jgi:STAS-like domain of unknown function (DUF4325)